MSITVISTSVPGKTAVWAETMRRWRFPIVLRGSTIVQIEKGRVARWSDYYDELTSRRGPLKAFFEEWIEY